MSTEAEYWEECAGDAFEIAGVFSTWGDLPRETRAEIGGLLARAAEGQSMAFPPPPSPYPHEITRLESALKFERSKVGCRSCAGSGRLSYSAGPWAVNTQCDACRGEGKVVP